MCIFLKQFECVHFKDSHLLAYMLINKCVNKCFLWYFFDNSSNVLFA